MPTGISIPRMHDLFLSRNAVIGFRRRRKQLVLRSLLWSLIMGLLIGVTPLSAQSGDRASSRPSVTRVLFLLDASGSMQDDWNGAPKFSIAKQLLAQAIDSVARENKNVEFGLRVFGHQSPRDLRDCEDSKLEVAFWPNNAANVGRALDRITPQGWTPIAYSLFLAAHDFPVDKRAVNVVVLITDGLENCDGDPCAASEALRNQRIALKPYVIGLGLAAEERAAFDCVGTYYDATEPAEFREALDVVISQALRNTTVQVNLLDQFGRATETDVELTFYDAYSRESLEHLVHTKLRNGLADTLYLDPAGRYNVVAHTTPPVARRNVELVAGQHNIIALEAPQGNLVLGMDGNSGFTDLKALVRDPGSGEILWVQYFNTSHRYIAGTYDIELLTLPRDMRRDVPILPGQDNGLRIPAPGRLLIQTNEPGVMAVFVSRRNRLELVHEWPAFSGREAIDLQPGEYTLVFRAARNKKIDRTHQQQAVVYSTKTNTVKFQ